MFSTVTLIIVAQVVASGREEPNCAGAVKVTAAARELFGAVRSNVGVAIEERLKTKTIALKDLDGILGVLNSESNKLHKTAFDGKLEVAARQVETARTRIATRLKNPANKAMAEELDLQQWVDEIARERTIGQILAGDIARMGSTVQELRHWVEILEPVAPPDQVASRLKIRLAQLLKEWRSLNPEVKLDSRHMEEQACEQDSHTRVLPSTNENAANECGARVASLQSTTLVEPASSGVPVYRVVQVSSAVGEVLMLAETGTQEAQILSVIRKSTAPFNLTADQIVAIRDKVCSHMIAAMVCRDGELRAIAARQRRT